MQLQDLAVFATVAAERSFSKAAKKLHRSQPSAKPSSDSKKSWATGCSIDRREMAP
jgi:hypothetical protein